MLWRGEGEWLGSSEEEGKGRGVRGTYCVEGVIVTLGDWGERCGTEREEGGYVEVEGRGGI